jgi:hypothetical protein
VFASYGHGILCLLWEACIVVREDGEIEQFPQSIVIIIIIIILLLPHMKK